MQLVSCVPFSVQLSLTGIHHIHPYIHIYVHIGACAWLRILSESQWNLGVLKELKNGVVKLALRVDACHHSHQDGWLKATSFCA